MRNLKSWSLPRKYWKCGGNPLKWNDGTSLGFLEGCYTYFMIRICLDWIRYIHCEKLRIAYDIQSNTDFYVLLRSKTLGLTYCASLNVFGIRAIWIHFEVISFLAALLINLELTWGILHILGLPYEAWLDCT